MMTKQGPALQVNNMLLSLPSLLQLMMMMKMMMMTLMMLSKRNQTNLVK